MFSFPALTTRPAEPAHHELVTTLLRTAAQVHAHLDWNPIEDWLGAQPILFAERGRRTIGLLAAPPDPPDVAWVRLFALAGDESPQRVWRALWPPAQVALIARGTQSAAGLSLDGWMDPLYTEAGFEHTHHVVVLTRPRPATPSSSPTRSDLNIRRAGPEDTPAIMAADLAAFAAPWQISPRVIQAALTQADYLTVAESAGQVVGYQLTTPNGSGGHLARLAVLPGWQGRGLGRALVTDLTAHYDRLGARLLTVNTQDTNTTSLAVYQHAGFELNGVRFPVFQLHFG